MNKIAPSPTPIHAAPARTWSDEFHQNTLGAAQKRIQPRLVADALEEIVRRRDAVLAEQAGHLHRQRCEGDNIDRGQQSQEQPLR